jgi:hypothetical protein
MNVLLINASAPSYNLAIEKARHYWQAKKATVHEATSVPKLFLQQFDLVCISAIFSWHVPHLIESALTTLEAKIPTEVGGPGTFGLRDVIKAATGLSPQSTPDQRFEQQSGFAGKACFWSRGCPAKNCTLGFPKSGAIPICSVPDMEGWRFTLYPETIPAPIILDNNLSALPHEHQELIIEKTLAAGFPIVDANSGFEPRSFRPETATRWKRLPLKAWRFAYDEIAELPAVLHMMEILDDAGISRKSRHIYCLAGNEPIEACEERVRLIHTLGSLPIVQRRRPLDWMSGPLPTLHDWTEQTLIDFQRWGNRLSASIAFKDYHRGMKTRYDQQQAALAYNETI